MDSPRLHASRFVVAVAGSIALVLSAPFIGYVRAWIRSQFPGQFVRIVGGLIGVVGLAAIGIALARIRERRAVRYLAIAGALICAAWYSAATATGVPEVDVVQRFHFIEYGLITFLFYRAWRPLEDLSIVILPALAGLLVGTADEWLQWFIPNRVGELDDIFLNGIAIACGLVFSLGADPPPAFRRTLRPGSLRRIGRFAAAFVLALALFFHAVHLGHDIADGEIGVFKSRYSKERLGAMASEKVEAWRTRPLPLVLQRVSREDQYMSEGVTHVQERNELLSAGEVGAAWKENRILEKYYAPVLDTPSYVSRTGHRWSPAQRGDIEAGLLAAQQSSPSAPYLSAANPYPIYPWRPARFWAIAIALAAAILVASAFRLRA
jgi:VanZ like protein